MSPSNTTNNKTPKSIVFFHPDLGIGGAERLIIDAAVALQDLGHRVTIYTSHRDVGHCFDEARDGTLTVHVPPTFLPPTLFGRFKILLTILRHIHLLLHIAFFTDSLSRLHPDVFFVDQLAAGIPLMRYLFPDVKVLFYCHFPDLLLVQGRERWWRGVWRVPFDGLEGWGMGGAERVVVNSGFTRGVVEGVWPGLGGRRGGKGERGVGVVYPCVDTTGKRREEGEEGGDGGEKAPWGGQKVVLSINRFERKKDVGLALRAFAGLQREVRKGVKLVLAGGYDSRVQENVSYHEELVALAEKLELTSATAKNVISALDVPAEIEVLFLLSVPGSLKDMLLRHAKLLVYTPTNEHFGIVPLEAMLAGVPVLASSTGGPLETVVDGKTGWLRDVRDLQAWTEVMEQVLGKMSASELRAMGIAGRERVKAEFSKAKMGKRLDEEIEEMVQRPRVQTLELQDLLLCVGIFGAIVVALGAMAFRYIPKTSVSG
ncbi:Alpha-1,3-mannosyltransferase-like protein [Thelotrema lepadinum]|nr:Alpha-1,3-mannosyltransferase-like protein [Thelotrema lepadinum]